MNILRISLAVAFFICSNSAAPAETTSHVADVIVYGDASGGVTAAVQAVPYKMLRARLIKDGQRLE